MGVGTGVVIELAKHNKLVFGRILGIGLLLLFTVNGAMNYSYVDASKNQEAMLFGNYVMKTVPEKALVFTDGDKDSFTLWYYHFVLKMRPDIAVIVTNLLPYDWYRSSLQKTYPLLVVPPVEGESWKFEISNHNKGHPVCETIVVDQALLRCQ
jgi:hypothetical protein